MFPKRMQGAGISGVNIGSVEIAASRISVERMDLLVASTHVEPLVRLAGSGGGLRSLFSGQQSSSYCGDRWGPGAMPPPGPGLVFG